MLKYQIDGLVQERRNSSASFLHWPIEMKVPAHLHGRQQDIGFYFAYQNIVPWIFAFKEACFWAPNWHIINTGWGNKVKPVYPPSNFVGLGYNDYVPNRKQPLHEPVRDPVLSLDAYKVLASNLCLHGQLNKLHTVIFSFWQIFIQSGILHTH